MNDLDWGRAKNVLIYAFLLLNLVLGYQIWMDARETAGANLDFTSLADNTQQAMEEKGIQVLAPIPNETPKAPKLSYEFTEEDKSGIEVELEEPVDSKLIFSPSELADIFAGGDSANRHVPAGSADGGRWGFCAPPAGGRQMAAL